jgi:class 3 adenylate cyclase
MSMNDSAVKRTLAAIMIGDVVGYSRLMGDDEAGTLRTLTRLRSTLIDPLIASHDGRLVNAVGDSLLAEFGSVIDATQCAIALQQGLADHNVALDDSRRIQLRIGVNIGDVIVQNRAVFGDAVNIAARLQSLAEPGGVCLSAAAHDQVRGKIDADFADAGAQAVKNIARPVGVFALSAVAIGALGRRPLTKARRGRRADLAAALACLLVLAAGAGAFYGRGQMAHADFVTRLDALLVATQTNVTERGRAKLIGDYLAFAPHRALVIAPKVRDHWWTGDWPDARIAETKALERCQIAFGEPCASVAADETWLAPIDARPPEVHEMPKVVFAGEFDPKQLPGVRDNVIARADVTAYLAAPEPKAAAIHPRGVLTVATGASSQTEANAKALKSCNDSDSARDADGPCYLYAEANKVVLPARRTKAATRP